MKSTLAVRTLFMTLLLTFSMLGAWASDHNLRSGREGISFYDKSCKMRFRILDEEAKTVALIPRSIEDVPTDAEVKYWGDIVLPNSVSYDGQTYTLVSIGDSAFYNCQDLTSITLYRGLCLQWMYSSKERLQATRTDQDCRLQGFLQLH